MERQRQVAATTTASVCTSVSTRTARLWPEQNVVAQTVTLDTDSAEPQKAAAVLGSVFCETPGQKDWSSSLLGLMLHFSYSHTYKHIKTTDTDLDEIW